MKKNADAPKNPKRILARVVAEENLAKVAGGTFTQIPHGCGYDRD